MSKSPGLSARQSCFVIRNLRIWLTVTVVILFFAAVFFVRLFLPAKAEAMPPGLTKAADEPSLTRSVVSRYGALPLSFELNQGQAQREVKFLSRGNGYGILLTHDGALLRAGKRRTPENGAAAPASSLIEWKIIGANSRAQVSGEEELPGKANYFIGNRPSDWRSNIPTFSKVRYRGIYPNVDLVYYGNQGQLEYDFILQPGVTPRRLKMSFNGMKSLNINADGDLILRADAGDLRLKPPAAYQTIDGNRHEIPAQYRVTGKTVSFDIGPYDKTAPLVIDPVLIYSSYLGGSSTEQGLGIAVDSQGSAYLTGSTSSADFPAVVGGFQTTKDAADDAFVVKLNPAGTAMVYSTYFGANGTDTANAIAVDSQGNAYITGLTASGSFPRVGGLQSSLAGFSDCFITKLNPSGSSLVYSIFLGGENSDTGFGISVDVTGRAYVVGRTDSTRLSFLPLQRHGSPLYKSTNGVGLWADSAANGLTTSTVSGITIDPSNANTIYAAGNTGVFKSTDGGTSWNITGFSRTSTAPIVSSTVAVDPTNPAIIYAGATNGVFKSTNGGPLYDQKNSGLTQTQINALAIDPTTPTTLYVGTAFGIFKSTNGADTWTEIKNGFGSGSSPRVNEIVLDPTNSATIYIGTSRGMFKSTNGGTLWTAINAGALSTPSTPEITALVIDPLHPSTLYASGRGNTDILFKSIDGGANWTGGSTGLSYTVVGIPVTPSIQTLAIDAISPTTLYAATLSGGIFKSTDSGASWSQSNAGMPNRSANAVAVDRTNSANVYAGVTIGSDAFATRLDAAGSIQALCNFGGVESDEARGVAIDDSGNAYVVGTTSSADFPTVNALQGAYGGFTDAFVSKLNPAGDGFVYSTYLGGNSTDQGRGIAVSGGNAFAVGTTSSPDFPLVNPVKGSLATFDTDAFVTRLSGSGNAAVYSTYVGGESTDQGLAIAVDNTGSAYITGVTNSSAFPTAGAFQTSPGGSNDAYISKLSPAGNALLFSSYLGGVLGDQGNGIAVDSFGNAYVIGNTSSNNFPTVRPFQAALKGTDAFVAKIGVESDLLITQRDSRDPVLVNTPFTYTLTVTNNGPSPATGVTVVDTLPPGTSLNGAAATQGSCSATSSQVTCGLGNIAVAGSALIAISVTPSATGNITNTATVTATEPDSITGNNTSSETTKVSASPSISGRIKDPANNGVGGIVVTLSGSQNATTQTDSTGFYQFAELPINGNYTVTPTNSTFSFDPESQTFNPLNVDQTANFLATTCTYSLGSTSQSFPAAGGSSNVTVNTLHGCPWTATSSAGFLSITSGASGVGSGLVNFSVTSTTAPRAAHLTIAGKNLPVYQEFNSCDTPSYSLATYNISSSGPNLVRIADFNGDGRADFVVATNAISGFSIPITVFLNDSTGGFTSSNVDTGLGVPQGIAVADFNGDGKPDIGMTTFSQAIVRIFFNNGSGGFSQANKSDITFTTNGGSAPTRDLFTGDLNRDGKADLVVQLPGTGFTQILLGNGNGTFTQIPAVSDGPAGMVIGLADVNGDNIIDFIYGGDGNSSKPISVRLGDGSGAFGAIITSSGMQSTLFAEPADFDGDGNVDLAASTVVNVGTPSNPNFVNAVSILVGDGAGHFVTKSSFNLLAQGSIPRFTVGDFNRDGKADVALTRLTSIVTIVLGDGIGGFGSPVTVDTGASSGGGPDNGGLGNADFNGDGSPDFAIADYSRGANVLRNTCAAAPLISGRVTDSRTSGGLAGATVTLSGAKSATAQTDGSGNYIFPNLTAGANYVVTPSKDNFKFNPASTSINNITGNQVANFVGTTTTFQFTSQDYVVNENAGSIQISVRRGGDLSGSSSVDYATGDLSASSRTDYTAAFGTLRFNPGESVKSFNVLITDDNLVEGFESVSLMLSNPVGGVFNSNGFEGLPPTSLLEIRDNDSTQSSSNPIDVASFFVQMHYHDFLNREADQSGLDFWTGQITSCGGDATCREVKRINVSAAFFLSIEFQQTGYLVERFYKTAFGDGSGSSTFGGSHQLAVPIVRFNEFLKDTQRIGQGVVVLAPGWEQALENNKQAYAAEFVVTSRFISAFPTNLTPAAFVDKLNQNAGSVLSPSERTTAINLFAGAADSSNNAARAQALRQVAEDQDLYTAEFNRAFVVAQFFGYLRRNPNDLPDSDYTGYDFWLVKLNQFNGDYIAAEMVKAFISSTEYRQRFGQ